jgi:hypothetical protein
VRITHSRSHHILGEDIIIHPQRRDRGGWDPYSPRGSGKGDTWDRSPLWGGYAQGQSSWAWAPCGCGGLWGPWARGNAYDSRGYPRGLHCGTQYPSQSHLGMAACGWSVVVGVGHAGKQLQRGGLGDPFGGKARVWGDLGGSTTTGDMGIIC